MNDLTSDIDFSAIANAGAGAAPPLAPPAPGAALAPAGTSDYSAQAERMMGALTHQESGGKQVDAQGRTITSSKGALGVAQMMPATAPEAAQLAGVPYDAERLRTDADYNRSLGKAYLAKQLQTFNDPAQALAAYNAGPGAMRSALARATQAGTPAAWLAYLPTETQKYVPAIMRNLGLSPSAAPGSAAPSVAPSPAPAPAAPAASRSSYYDGRPDRSFTSVNAAPGATVGDFAKELGASALDSLGFIGQAAGEAGAAIANKTTGSSAYEGKNLLAPATEKIRDSMSDGGKAARADADVQGDALDPSSWRLPTTPAGWGMVFTNGLGSLASTVIPLAGPLARISMLAKAAKAAELAGDATKAAQLVAQAQGVARISTGIGAAAGAMTTGGAAANEVRGNVEQAMKGKTHEELLRDMPAYADAFRASGDAAQARQAVVNYSAQAAGVLSGIAGAAGGVLNAKVLEGMLVENLISRSLGKTTASRLGRTAIGAAGGTVAEGFQEGAEKTGQNVGENIGMGRPAGEDVTRNSAGDVIGGMMVGGAMGGPAGLASKHHAKPVVAPVAVPQTAPNSPLGNAANAGVAAAANAAAAAPPVAPAADPIADKVAQIQARVKGGGLIEALRSADSPVNTKTFLNDLAMASSPSAQPQLREQAMTRLEFAMGWADQNPAVRPATGIDSLPFANVGGDAPQGPRPSAPQIRAGADQDAALRAQLGAATTESSREQIRKQIEANRIANMRAPAPVVAPVDNGVALPFTDETPSLTTSPGAAPAQQQAPSVTPEVQDGFDTGNLALKKEPTPVEQANDTSMAAHEQGALQRQAGADAQTQQQAADAQSWSAARPEPDAVIAAMKPAPFQRTAGQKALIARARSTFSADEMQLLDRAANQAFGLSAIDRTRIADLKKSGERVDTQQSVSRETVEAPRVVAPAGAAPAFLRKRRAQLDQIAGLGFDTVERDGDGFAFVNSKTNQQIRLDGRADAQLARAAIASHVDAQAHEAAASPSNDLTEPTEGQVEAGNYKKGAIANLNGVRLSIENPRGSMRRGVAPDGTAWETELAHHYGDVAGTLGADGDPVDVFIGPRPDSSKIYVVDQNNADGSFDEHKVMMGFTSETAARAGYLANYDAGWAGLGAITEMTPDQFKSWVRSDATKVATASTAPGTVSIVNDGQAVTLPLVAPSQLPDTASPDRGAKSRLLTKSQAALLGRVAAVFGKQVQLFSDPQRALKSDGFVRPGDRNTVYLNERSTISALAVFGHELMHLLRADNPEAYAALAAVVSTRLNDEAGFRKYYGDDGLTKDAMVEELTSDLNGDLMSDGKFWREVFDKIEADNPAQFKGIVARLAAALYAIIDAAVASFKGADLFGSKAFIDDSKAVRAAFRDALAAYAKDKGSTRAALQAEVLKSGERDLGAFRKNLLAEMGARAEYAAMLARQHDWAFNVGDTFLSTHTGKTVRIIGRTFTSVGEKLKRGVAAKLVPTYAYEGGDAPPAGATRADQDAHPGEWSRGMLREDRLLESKTMKNLTTERPMKFSRDREHAEALRETGFWGRAGAGSVVMARDTGRILLPHRSASVQEPNTWGTWGGAIDSNEDPAAAAKRELREEAGVDQDVELRPLLVFKKGDFKYHNFLALVDHEFEPSLNWETQASRWVDAKDIPSPMHPGLKALLADQASRNEIDRHASGERSGTPQSEYDAIDTQYRDTPQWMKAPNGDMTALTERQWVQVRTPSFKAWFGDWEAAHRDGGSVWNDDAGKVSKAVGPDGEPLVLYHGTDSGGFAEFKRPAGGRRGHLGIFMTANRALAASYVRKGRARMATDADVAQLSESDRQDVIDEAVRRQEAGRQGGPTSYVGRARDVATFEQALGLFGKSLVAETLGRPEFADGKPLIYALFANLRNPLEEDFEGANWDGTRGEQWNVYLGGENQADHDGKMHFSRDEAEDFAKTFVAPEEEDDPEEHLNYLRAADDHHHSTDSAVGEARANGNDGAVLRDVQDDGGGNGSYAGEPTTNYVAFEPSQVKSADFSVGAYSANEHDIRFSRERTLERVDPMEISARSPSAKPTKDFAPEDALKNLLISDFAAGLAQPKWLAAVAGLVEQYPNYRDAPTATTPERKLERLVRQMADNLVWLHDQVPADTRERSKLWYDGARRIAERMAKKYDITEAQSAGILASLSPQKDWFMNISLADRVAQVMADRQAFHWSKSMDDTADRIFAGAVYREDVDAVRGSTLADLDDRYLKSMWLRVYDEAHNPRSFMIVSPEGDPLAEARTLKGEPAKTAWGSLPTIAKAISIFDNGSFENINEQLGRNHKVRNFFNNILVPNSPNGHVTIDTHAVAAALLRPLSRNSIEVMHNFDGPKSAAAGLVGSYALYEEAYRRAAEARDLLPRELQSITWEAVRGLFSPTFKSQAKNVSKVNRIWTEYKKGRLSHEDARDQTLAAAGGIAPPSWSGRDPGAYVEDEPAVDRGNVRGDELAGQDGGPVERRGAGVDPRGLDASVAAGAAARDLPDAGRVRRSPGRVAVEGRPDQGPGGTRESDGSLQGLPRQVAGFTASHWAPAATVAERYMAARGLAYEPPASYAKVDPERARRIATAYDAMPDAPRDPAVRAAYQAMIDETVAQYRAVAASGLVVEFIDFNQQGDPYAASPRLMTEDVRENNHMWVFSTRDGFGSDATFDPADSPLLTETGITISGQPALANDLFRVVHDYFGHVKEGVGFRADGEENAWRAHSAMYSALARQAMTSETRGQNSWVNYGPHGDANRTANSAETHFADQKVGLLPAWANEEGRGDAAADPLARPESNKQFVGKQAVGDNADDAARQAGDARKRDAKAQADLVELRKRLSVLKSIKKCMG